METVSISAGRLAARVEDVCLNAWPALQEIHYDGWLIRLADGQTRRTNSVNVLHDGSLPARRKNRLLRGDLSSARAALPFSNPVDRRSHA